MHKLKALAGGLAIVAVATVTMGSGDSDTATKVDGAGASSSTAPKASETFNVGDTVKLGDWSILVNKVTDPLKPKNEFLKPEAGMRWVRVDATVTNGSKEAQAVSSIACFDLRDSDSKKYTITITGMPDSQLDGQVAAGDKLRGSLDFEIPKAAKGLVLSFQCDFLSSGTAQIKLS